MNDLKQFFKPYDFNTQRKTGRQQLSSNEISVWYNIKNSNYCFSIPNTIAKDFSKLEFLFAGEKKAIRLNNLQGLRISKRNNNVHQVSCMEAVALFFKNFDKPKERKILKLEKIAEDFYLINEN